MSDSILGISSFVIGLVLTDASLALQKKTRFDYGSDEIMELRLMEKRGFDPVAGEDLEGQFLPL